MPTLLSTDGTPVTLPVPPNGPGFEPDYHQDALRRILVGRSLGEVVTTLEATGWTVQLIDVAEPAPTMTTDIDPRRARVFHRDDVVTDVQVDPWPDTGDSPNPATSTTTTTTVDAIATTTTTTTTTTTVAGQGESRVGGALDDPVVTLPGAEEVARADDGARSSYEERIEALLVGLDLDRAVAELESVGWTVRTDDLDESTETFTMDERGDRANISHRDGIVVSVGLF